MGSRGPTKQTRAKQRARGNPSKRRGRKSAPKPPPSPVGDPPDWLTEEARVEWQRIVPQLQQLGTLHAVDRPALTAYCQAWANFVEAARELAAGGLTFETEKGYVGKNPACTIQKEAAAAILAFAKEFGLTAQARIRLEIGAGTGSDDPASGVGDYAQSKGGS